MGAILGYVYMLYIFQVFQVGVTRLLNTARYRNAAWVGLPLPIKTD